MPEVKDQHFVEGGQDVPIPAHLNFGKFMFDRIRRYGDEVALCNTTTEEKLTYKTLTQLSVNMSVGFSKLGMKRGDVVIFGTDHRVQFVPTALAVIFTGATISPVYIQTGKAILKHRLTVIPPTYLICTGSFWESYCEVLEEIKTFKAIVSLDDIPKSAITVKSMLSNYCDIDKFEPAEVKGQQDAAVIYYSSGTTGFPKAVELTHVNCILHCLPDNYESFTTAYHIGHWAVNYFDFKTYEFLANGKRFLYSTIIKTTETFIDIVEKYKVEVAFFVPAVIYKFLNSEALVQNHDVSSLKIIYSRSSPLHTKTIARIKNMFLNRIEVYQAYGMTECGELTSEIRATEGPKPGSVGMPSPGIRLKIVDVQTGESLPPNQKGEICVKGAAVMKGYVGVDPTTYCDKDGYFKTGDLGYYDENKYFYIIDRLKEIMSVNGCNVAPIELETLLQLHPGVKETGVVGKPHEEIGDLPTAFVVRQPRSTVTEQELKDYIASEVGPFMQLTGGVKFIPELPRNERGKILRRRLREMLNEV